MHPFFFWEQKQKTEETHTNKCTCAIHSCKYTHTHTHIHTHTHTHINHACMRTYIHIQYIYTYTHMHACMHACIHTCIHTFTNPVRHISYAYARSYSIHPWNHRPRSASMKHESRPVSVHITDSGHDASQSIASAQWENRRYDHWRSLPLFLLLLLSFPLVILGTRRERPLPRETCASP